MHFEGARVSYPIIREFIVPYSKLIHSLFLPNLQQINTSSRLTNDIPTDPAASSFYSIDMAKVFRGNHLWVSLADLSVWEKFLSPTLNVSRDMTFSPKTGYFSLWTGSHANRPDIIVDTYARVHETKWSFHLQCMDMFCSIVKGKV